MICCENLVHVILLYFVTITSLVVCFTRAFTSLCSSFLYRAFSLILTEFDVTNATSRDFFFKDMLDMFIYIYIYIKPKFGENIIKFLLDSQFRNTSPI